MSSVIYSDDDQPHSPLTNQKNQSSRNEWKYIAIFFLVIYSITMTALYLTDDTDEDSTSGGIEIGNVVHLVTYNDVYTLTTVQDTNGNQLGGPSRAATYIKGIRSQYKHVLVLMGGDTISPSLESQFFYGAQMIDVHNQMGLDYACLGNHEFDMGVPILRQRIAQSKFVWLNSNVREPDNSSILSGTKENAVVDYGFTKIGLFGLVYQMYPATDNSSGAIFLDPLQVAEEQVNKLRGPPYNCDYIIAITHELAASDCQLAKLSGLDFIVAGHEHDMQGTTECGLAPYMLASSDWKNIWHHALQFSSASNVFISYVNDPMTSDVPNDPQMDVIVNYYENQIANESNVVVGSTSVELDCRTYSVRYEENAFGNFVADEMTELTKTLTVRANMSLMNGGGIRTNAVYPPGNVTKGTVLSILPFGNVVVLLQITGQNLKDAIEEYLVGAENAVGTYPQVSGMQFIFNTSLPNGGRVVALNYMSNGIVGTPISPTDVIYLATIDYVYETTIAFSNAQVLVSPEEGTLLSSVALQGFADKSPIAPQIEGRSIRL